MRRPYTEALSAMLYRFLLLIFSTIFILSGCTSKAPSAVSVKGMTWQQALHIRLKEYEPYSRQQLTPDFAKVGLPYAPKELAFIIFKDAKVFDIYARNRDRDDWRFVKQYRIYAASGGPGPKLTAGDHQVPEGVYSIVALNPRSRFDLSMQLNYPNQFDRQEAMATHRVDLGGDIFIHGDALSVGCIALGNAAIQQIFPLVYAVGEAHVIVVIAPDDLRTKAPLVSNERLQWLPVLYLRLKQELKQFPVAQTS